MKSFRRSFFSTGALLFLGFAFLFLPLFFHFLDQGAYTIWSERVDLIAKWRDLQRLITYFKASLFFVGLFVLVLSSIVYWVVLSILMRPIQQILDQILSCKEGTGELLPLNVPPFSQGHNLGKLVYAFNALSERVRLQVDHVKQQARETEGILESLNEGIIAFDASAKVTFANRIAYRILGVATPSLTGESLLKQGSSDFLQKCNDIVLQALQTAESVHHTWRFSTGPYVYLDLIAQPMIHHGGAILVLQDKTSDTQIVEMGKDFIANASHELKTPITIIRGFAETLRDAPRLSAPVQKEILEKIVRTTERLDNLVKSLLMLADAENFSTSKFRPCDFRAILDHCHHLLLMAHPSVQVALDSNPQPIWLFADRDLLELAVMNLLENAVKYSSSPSSIAIEIRTSDAWVEISFQDRGIGIPAFDLPRIFDRFYTVDKAHSRKTGGAGLGLSIVKTIIEKHGGMIFADSEVGKGSVFTIHFPQRVLALCRG